jgi:hypothetical protein
VLLDDLERVERLVFDELARAAEHAHLAAERARARVDLGPRRRLAREIVELTEWASPSPVTSTWKNNTVVDALPTSTTNITRLRVGRGMRPLSCT